MLKTRMILYTYTISLMLLVSARWPCRGSLGFAKVTMFDTAAIVGLSNPAALKQQTKYFSGIWRYTMYMYSVHNENLQ